MWLRNVRDFFSDEEMLSGCAILTLIFVFFLVIVVIIIKANTWHDMTGNITGIGWRYEMPVYEYTQVRRGTWQNQLPQYAYNVSLSRRAHGETCRGTGDDRRCTTDYDWYADYTYNDNVQVLTEVTELYIDGTGGYTVIRGELMPRDPVHDYGFWCDANVGFDRYLEASDPYLGCRHTFGISQYHYVNFIVYQTNENSVINSTCPIELWMLTEWRIGAGMAVRMNDLGQFDCNSLKYLAASQE